MTDHAAEARRIMSADVTVPRDQVGILAVRAAHVHATLALADEQRTANQLAWLTFRSTDGMLAASDTGAFLDVAARLGLTPTTPNQEQP